MTGIAISELAFQNREKEKRADELVIGKQRTRLPKRRERKRADELIIAIKSLPIRMKRRKKGSRLIIAIKSLREMNKNSCLQC